MKANLSSVMWRTACAPVLSLALAGGAHALTVTVPGTANIYGAGHGGAAATPAPAGQGGGSVAPSVDVSGLASIGFGAITGTVDLGCAGGCAGGPDGQPLGASSHLLSYNGISGVYLDRRAPLLGVFVGAGEPADPAPAMLHFEGALAGFTSLAPLLNQTFFIGDGLTGTGSGSSQQFFVPAGATRLFLGIADGFVSGGLPGGYGNNTGAFVVNVNVSPVPEPAGWAMALAGGLLLGMKRARRAALPAVSA